MVTPRPVLRVDLTACCRSGVCAMTAPDLISQSDDATPVMLAPTGDPDLTREQAHEVIALCPSGALSLNPEPLSGTVDPDQATPAPPVTKQASCPFEAFSLFAARRQHL